MNDNESTGLAYEELEHKWDFSIKGANGGFTAIPNLLLKKQGELNLKPSELNVLLNLIRFWWSKDKLPFPALEKMAIEMGVNERTIYRNISSLEEKGFINKIQDNKTATKYDLSGLIEKLKIIKNAM